MEPTVTLAGLIGMVALGKTLVDYLRELSAWFAHRGSAASVLHRTIAYVVGMSLTFLYGASQLGDFAIPGTKLLLSNMDGPTKAIVGLSVGGTMSLAADYLKARDNTDSAKVPPIISP